MVIPRLLLHLVVRALPPQHRDRYRRELMAELGDVPRAQRLAHAARVLLHAGALRAALGGSPSSDAAPARPLGCRTRLRHRWRRTSTEDGGRYIGCAHCPAVRHSAYDVGDPDRAIGVGGVMGAPTGQVL